MNFNGNVVTLVHSIQSASMCDAAHTRSLTHSSSISSVYTFTLYTPGNMLVRNLFPISISKKKNRFTFGAQISIRLFL